MDIPKQIDIEVTSACNLKCRFCPGLNTRPNHMDIDLFKSIIDRIDFTTTVVPWLNGEPLLHPQYYDMIKYINDRGIRYYITTNGMVKNQRLFELITSKESSCYQIIVSIDGIPETDSMELARPGTGRGKVLSTLAELCNLKRDNGGDIEIAVKICRRGQDWEEIEKFISLYLNLGIDFVIVGDQLVEENNPEGFRQYPCQYSDNNFMVIKSDGRVVLCAYNTEATNNQDYTMGSVVNDTPLLDIYNNDNFKTFRKNQRAGVFTGPCKTCGFAYTGNGFRGIIKLRNKFLIQDDIFYSRDYYNQFFSLKKRWKEDRYYERGFYGPVEFK